MKPKYFQSTEMISRLSLSGFKEIRFVTLGFIYTENWVNRMFLGGFLHNERKLVLGGSTSGPWVGTALRSRGAKIYVSSHWRSTGKIFFIREKNSSRRKLCGKRIMSQFFVNFEKRSGKMKTRSRKFHFSAPWFEPFKTRNSEIILRNVLLLSLESWKPPRKLFLISFFI